MRQSRALGICNGLTSGDPLMPEGLWVNAAASFGLGTELSLE